MNTPAVVTLAVVAGAALLFLSDRLRPDVVALLVLLFLGLAGILTPQEAFSGFGRSAVITIIGIFVIAEGLRRTRATEQAGALLLRLAGGTEMRLVAVLMTAGAVLSLFMNNIAAAAVLLPATTSAARRTGISPSRLMMPLAFATILGGMATLLTTTNIVASGLLRDQHLPGFGLLDFAAVGLPILAVGTAYMITYGRRRLPSQSPAEREAARERARVDLVQEYGIDHNLFEAVVPAGSALGGRPLSESTLRERFAVEVVAIQHDGHTHLAPPAEALVFPGDVLLLAGDLDDFRSRDVEPYLEIRQHAAWHESDLRSPDVIVAEAVVAPRSTLLGLTLRESHFRTKYGMTALAIWRAGDTIRVGTGDVKLQYGDGLLLQGPRDRLPALRADPDVIIVGDPGGHEDEDVQPRRRALAWSILVLTLALAALGPDAVGQSMLAGGVAMVLVGMLTMDQAYAAIDWRTVFLVAGILPLGVAMAKTGAADPIAAQVLAVAGPFGPRAVLGAMVLITVLLTQVMHGAAVVAIMTPIAIRASAEGGLDTRALVMGVALATSVAFVTPLGHPVNMLVMSVGGYRVRDFVRVGLPLTILVVAMVILLVPIVWPLVP